MSRWQDAVISYDATLNHCLGNPPYSGRGFWRRCIAGYQRRYLAAAAALDRMTAHCGRMTNTVHGLVSKMSAAYERAWVAGKHFVYAAQDFAHRKAHGPRVGYLMSRADALRVHVVKVAPALTAGLRRTCA